MGSGRKKEGNDGRNADVAKEYRGNKKTEWWMEG
jgi:hypothetical protein